MTIDRVISLRKEAGIEPVVVQQNDRQSRTVRFFLMEAGGSPFNVEGKQARMLFRKNGATSPAYEATVQPDGWISLTVPDEVTANPGNGEMQLALVDGGYTLHSFTVPFSVRPSLSFIGETESPADDPMAVNWKNLPGKPDTFPPSGHTHTPAQAGALAADGTAVNAAKLNGKPAGYYLCPEDHLTNGCFVRPVNQRGATLYSKAGYDIDRWRHGNSNLTVEVANGCIRLTNNGATGLAWQQIIDRDLAGHRVTVALCQTNGTVTANSGDIPAAAVTADTALFTTRLADDTGSVVLYKHANGTCSYRIFVTAGKTMELRWAALYEGAFTAADLPEYRPRDYAAQLAECRRYFRRIRAESAYAAIGTGMAYSSTKAWIAVPRTRMRLSSPTVTIGGDSLRLYAGSATVEGTELAVSKISDSCLLLTATVAGVTNGAALVATNGTNTAFYIDEDADL